MRPRPLAFPIRIAVVVFFSSLAARSTFASGATDHFRAGRQAWFELDWSGAVRQFSLALADSLEPSRRIDALFYRADALSHLHDCARVVEDVSALRSLGATAIGTRRCARLDRMLADCEHEAAHPGGPPIVPVHLRLHGGTHRYSAATPWLRSFGAELAFARGSLQGLVRGGWIGANDYAGELGLRLFAPSSYRLRPWIEGSVGLQRLRPARGFIVMVSVVEWDSLTTTFGANPEDPSFHGTSVGLGVGLDVPIHSVLGIGVACRWRHIDWKSDRPVPLPGDDREVVGYLFAR